MRYSDAERKMTSPLTLVNSSVAISKPLRRSRIPTPRRPNFYELFASFLGSRRYNFRSPQTTNERHQPHALPMNPGTRHP